MTTRQSFHEQLKTLQRDLLRMGVFVNEAIQHAVDSLARQDIITAQQVIDGDDVVDNMLIDIEKRCLQLMALQQPMASDLRAIGTALKIVTDLERMADHATDIAKVTLRLDGEPLVKRLVDIPRMTELVRSMTAEALEAYVHQDVARARSMVKLDDEIDRLYRTIFDELIEIMQQKPQHIKQATYLLQVAMYLERIGDHATNLGEWTIFMVTGELTDMNS